MRWLIVGPYPPERGRGAEAAARFAAERIDAGDEIHVVSPRPSAAHEHRDLVGRDALRWLRRTASHHDAVWIRIEAGIAFTREPSRVTALWERFLLGRILRTATRSTIDVGDVSMLPGGRAGSLVFGSVDDVVAHSSADRDALGASGASGVRLDADFVAAPTAADVTNTTERRPVEVVAPMAPLGADAGRAEIEGAIQARAREAPVS